MTAAALAAAATVLPGLLRVQPYTRPYGEWIATAQLAAQGPFTFQARQLSAGEEILSVVSGADSDVTCAVRVTTASERIRVPTGRTAALEHRPARFVDRTDESGAGLWWSVGPRTSALATCDDQAADQTLLELARQVQFLRLPVRVPFDLSGLSVTDEVHTYVDYSGSIGVLVTRRGEAEDSPDAVYVGLVAMTNAGGVSGRRVDIEGRPGRMTDDENETTVCWPDGLRTVCAGIVNAESSADRALRTRRTARVLQTARLVRLASDLDQPSTWFDAQDAFTH